MKKIYLFIAVSFFIASCGNKNEDSGNEEQTPEKVYKIDHSKTKLEWEAYKFTEKKGVKGAFDNIAVTPVTEKGSLADLINGTSFEIDINSTNSGDPTRDPKIISHFFGSMMNTALITGAVKEYKSNSDTEGEAVVAVRMNEKTVDVPAKVQIGEKTISLTANIDVASWEAVPSLDSLNTVCEDLHKGEDGNSKLWPDVSITITTEYYEAE